MAVIFDILAKQERPANPSLSCKRPIGPRWQEYCHRKWLIGSQEVPGDEDRAIEPNETETINENNNAGVCLASPGERNFDGRRNPVGPGEWY
jgi:hypothetical protein